jgi:sulfate adenylyltransferase subunit 1 (EFTu-like GTPase family)
LQLIFRTTEASQLAINEIGEVNIKLSKALYFDAYSDNKSNGAFILMMQQQTQRRELAL